MSGVRVPAPPHVAHVPENISFKDKILLKLYCYLKLPLIAYCRPKIITLTYIESIVEIPLNRRTKNHFKSMYFGALSIGADFTGGLLVMNMIKKNKSKSRLLFKDFSANFIKRCTTDIVFSCSDHAIIQKSIDRNLETGERVNFKLKVQAFSKNGEHVADFVLTTSIK